MKQLDCCPECGSEDMETGDEFYDDDGMHRVTIECISCGHKWVEVYQFLHNETADTHELLVIEGGME